MGTDVLKGFHRRRDYPALMDRLAETFQVLGDPTRVKILMALTRGELRVGGLAEEVGMTASSVSHQLRLLRHNRLVRFRKEGKSVIYALDDEHVAALFREGIRHVEDLP